MKEVESGRSRCWAKKKKKEKPLNYNNKAGWQDVP